MRILLAGLVGMGLAQRIPLPPSINTPLHESAPVISADGRQLFFWRLDDPMGFGAQDIFYAVWDEEKREFGPPIHLGSAINDPRGNIPFGITPDGQYLLVYREFRNPHNPCELGLSRRISGDIWGAPIQLKIHKFYSESGSSLTAALGWDGHTLLLSMKGKGRVGGEDLYVSFYDPEQKLWSEPLHLGPLINTVGDEITPFLAPDGVTLYFSSNGRPDSKGMDIYMTRRLDETWQHWSIPQRLPEPINSEADDYYFKFAALKPEVGYFVSTDSMQLGKQLYQAIIPTAYQPKPTVLVQGRVLERNGRHPIPNAEVRYYDLVERKLEGAALSAEGTGTYRLLLPMGTLYGIIVINPGYFSLSEQVDLRHVNGQSRVLEKDILVVPLQADEVFRLNGLFFESGDSTLAPESYLELERLSWLLSDKPTMRIEIIGHTDSTGDLERNILLSWRRANAVAKYLTARGISEERLRISGKGPTQPIADNRTPEGRALNRRVEFRVLSP